MNKSIDSIFADTIRLARALLSHRRLYGCYAHDPDLSQKIVGRTYDAGGITNPK